MQAERDKRPIEGIGFQRQSISSAAALKVRRYRLFVLVTDIEHRQSLIDTDNATSLDVLGNRPGDAPSSGSQVEHPFVTAKRQHLDHLDRQRTADPLHGITAVKFRRVRRIVEAGLMIVPMTVTVLVGMTAIVRVLVIM